MALDLSRRGMGLGQAVRRDRAAYAPKARRIGITVGEIRAFARISNRSPCSGSERAAGGNEFRSIVRMF